MVSLCEDSNNLNSELQPFEYSFSAALKNKKNSNQNNVN